MKGSVNKAHLIGNLGQDPETSYTPNGVCITTISLATSYKPRDDEAKTEWHNIKFIGGLAELAGQILYKGAKVYVEGRNQTDRWNHREYSHIKMSKTWVIGNILELLSEFQTDAEKEKVDIPLEGAQNVNQAINGAAHQHMPSGSDQQDRADFDDDIPF